MSDYLEKRDAVKTPWGVGWVIKQLYKWRRPEGPASFFTDRLALRKSLSLCATCEKQTLPRRWEDRYNYQLVRHFHGDGIGCDYCRADESTNLYIPVEGDLAADYRMAEKSVPETKRRDMQSMQYVY